MLIDFLSYKESKYSKSTEFHRDVSLLSTTSTSNDFDSPCESNKFIEDERVFNTYRTIFAIVRC